MSRHATILIALCCLFTVGCSVGDIDRTYGRRRGTQGGSSVNGTAVFAKMFREAGYRVNSWRRLSPKLEDAKVIVWFPDDFKCPDSDHRDYLVNWLGNEPDRTLIYVGRDYDAAVAYWRKVQPTAPPEQAMEVARRRATVQSEHDKRRTQIPVDENCDWFSVRRDGDRQQVESLLGEWSESVDASQVEMELAARFDVPEEDDRSGWDNTPLGQPDYEVLLSSGDDPLVTRVTGPGWEGSQILVVTNGSFLLNLQLVNQEHRKLAGKMISACGEADRVVFLESGAGGLLILDREPDESYPTGLEVFTVWPIGAIVLHLTALGILACFALFPIFGRAKTVYVASAAEGGDTFASGKVVESVDGSSTAPRVVRAHFGRHIEALGELLETCGDREYAARRVRYYNEHVRSEPSGGHRKETKEV